nr:hypothetical protein [Tanacetum cinerariifolium]
EERRDEKNRLDHLKQDQTMLAIKRFIERKNFIRKRKKTGKIHAKRLKKDQEKDKIESKPDKNGKRGEAGKCQKQLL